MAAIGVEEFRAILLKLQQETNDQLLAGKASGRPVALDQQAIGRLSRMDAIANQQMALAQKARAEAMLKAIADALVRLDKGDFGYCDDCGEEIETGRLRLNPTVRLCVDCARG